MCSTPHTLRWGFYDTERPGVPSISHGSSKRDNFLAVAIGVQVLGLQPLADSEMGGGGSLCEAPGAPVYKVEATHVQVSKDMGP